MVDFFFTHFQHSREPGFADFASRDFDQFTFFHFEGDPVEDTLLVHIGDGASTLTESDEGHFLLETDFTFGFILLWIEAITHRDLIGRDTIRVGYFFHVKELIILIMITENRGFLIMF